MITMPIDPLGLDANFKHTIEKSVSDFCIIQLFSGLYEFSLSKKHKNLNKYLTSLSNLLSDDFSKSLYESASKPLMDSLSEEEKSDPITKEYFLMMSNYINNVIKMYVESFTLVIENTNSLMRKR